MRALTFITTVRMSQHPSQPFLYTFLEPSHVPYQGREGRDGILPSLDPETEDIGIV